MKKAITYSANLIKSANSVKWIFELSFGQPGETRYLGGTLGPLKVKEVTPITAGIPSIFNKCFAYQSSLNPRILR